MVISLGNQIGNTGAFRLNAVDIHASADDDVSAWYHAAHGFRHTGVLQSAGYKLGQWVDVVLMQRALGLGDTTKAL